MYKRSFFFVFVFLFLFSLTFVASAPPQESNTGYIVRSGIQEYIMQGQDYDAHAHVFLESDGTYVTDATCYLHLYDKTGQHLYEGVDNTVSHDFDYSWDIGGGNFSTIGVHQIIVQCNGSVGVDDFGGFFSEEVYVNGYGEELHESDTHMFNSSMMFLMILFIISLVVCFKSESYLVKFATYWICHVFFVVGTFSVWQFTSNYAMAFVGLSGVWKILFYVSTIAVFPMLILSLAWIFYIHTFNEHFEKLIDKGVSTEEAFKMANKKSGGWKSGK